MRTGECATATSTRMAANRLRLRLKPGDLLILSLKNELTLPAAGVSAAMSGMRMAISGPCASGVMTSSSTNLHFHGISVPPVCHQDDVLKTVIQPGDPPFVYRFRIPANEPPGLYWYHPHVHGFNKPQVAGGASGALIVEGIERANRELAGLPERVFVIRDQDLLNPQAEPPKTSAVPPMVLHDAEGDILNTGTGLGKPAMDLSLNFVPVPFPDYTPAVIAAEAARAAILARAECFGADVSRSAGPGERGSAAAGSSFARWRAH